MKTSKIISDGQSGFTLIEIMVVMAISLFIATLLLTTYERMVKSHTVQTEIMTVQQNLLGTVELMEKEIRLSGFRRDKDHIVIAEPHKFSFWADIDNQGGTTLDDGTVDPSTEHITYEFDPDTHILTRQMGEETPMVFSEGIDSMEFDYYDAVGSQLADTVTPAANRDQIRRIRITATDSTENLTSRLSDQDRVRTVIRDIAPPNLTLTPLVPCGMIVLNAGTPLKACNPPGNNATIQVLTYNKDSVLTTSNAVAISANQNSDFYTDADATNAATLPLPDSTRASDTTLYLKTTTYTAGETIQVQAKWTPPDEGCFERQTMASITIAPGDACKIEFLDPANNDVTACNAPGCANTKTLAVRIVDACGNPVPNVLAKFSILENSSLNRGKLNGNYTAGSPINLTSGLDGTAILTYEAPPTITADTVFIEGAIDNPGEGCTGLGSQGIDLVACVPTAFELVPLSSSPKGCMNRYYPFNVKVKDACGNPVAGLADVKTEIVEPVGATGKAETVSLLDGTGPGVSVMTTPAAGESGKGIYQARYNTRTDTQDTAARTVHLKFTQPQIVDPLDMPLLLDACACGITEISVPETYCTRGISKGCPIDAILQGWLEDKTTHQGRITVTAGSVEIRTGADFSNGPYADHTPDITLGASEDYIPVALRNVNTEVNQPVSLRLEEFAGGVLQCTADYTTRVACSKSEIQLLDKEFLNAITYDPYDDSEEVFVSVKDCNRVGESDLTIKLFATSGDIETITLAAGQDTSQGVCYYRNAAGIPITAQGALEQEDGTLEVYTSDRIYAQFVDSTGGCCTDVSTDYVDLVSFCMPMALYSGMNGSFQGTAMRVHWGDIVVNGNISFTGQMKNKVPQKDSTVAIADTTQPYSGNDWPDRWVDLYVGGTVNGDTSGNIQPFTATTPPFLNIFQNLTPDILNCLMSKLNYDNLKAFAILNGVYYYSTADDKIRKPGETSDRDFQSEVINNGRQFMFVDIIDATSLTFTGADLDAGTYNAKFPTHSLTGNFYYKGFIYIAGNLKVQGLGSTTTINNISSPPAKDVDEPLFLPNGTATEGDLPVGYQSLAPVTGLSLEVHLNGSAYVKGYMDINANISVFGSLGAEKGFSGTGNPEIWYNYAGARACAGGSCCKLRVVPSEVNAVPGEQITLAVSGSKGGQLTWTLETNNSGATLTAAGVYTAGSAIGTTDTILVSEAGGCRPNTATIHVVCPTITVTGATPVTVGETAVYTASSGATPYVWSVSPSTYASIDSSTGLLTGLAAGTVTVTATDANGCTGTLPNVVIRTAATCNNIFFDNFDQSGTSITSDWTSSGTAFSRATSVANSCSDPTAAYSGAKVIGTVINSTGCYSNNRTYTITSRAIVLTGKINATIQWYQWLNVRNGDNATVSVSCNGGTSFTTLQTSTNVTANSWTQKSYVVPACDGVASMKVKFELASNNSNNTGGWNIDDFSVCAFDY